MKKCVEKLSDHVHILRAGQQLRRIEFLQAARDFFRPFLDDQGRWIFELTQEMGRLDLQVATAFYMGDLSDQALANRLTCRAPLSVWEGNHFNIFNTSIMAHHLLRFGHLMDRQAYERCEQMLREGCAGRAGMMAPDFQFHGYNDNMPAMAVKTLILAGERFNEPSWVQMGVWKLQRLAEMLSRCGLIGEYNSPNYSPDTIHNLMSLHTYTRLDQVREHTAKIVRRIWLDVAAHWHSAARCPAGPFSRAYIDDLNNYISPLNCLCWFLFGPEVSGISAMEAITPRNGLECMHGNDPVEHTARMAWYAMTDDSLLDDDVAGLFVSKPESYNLITTTEQGNTDHAPLKSTTLTTYIQHEYSLGSASFSFCDGEQTASLYVTGRCSKDISPVLYTRYLVDNATPGQSKDNTFHRRTHGEAYVSSRATSVTVQHEKSALLSMVPHRHLSGNDVHSLRMAIVAPDAVGQFDGFVNAHGEPLIPGEYYPAKAWYGAQLGDAYIAIHPLAYSVMDIPACKVLLRTNDKYQYLEVINYEGVPRRYSQHELSILLNGMAMELASADDWHHQPGAFVTAIADATTFEDHYYSQTRRLRYHRKELFDRQALVMSLSYSTLYDGVAIRTINGKYAPQPIWQCTGIPQDTLPYLYDDAYIAPPGLPWTDLSYPRSSNPWAIGESGNSPLFKV